ncbi:outer membrane protein assembly factor BamB family protein [Lentibacillus sp. Marseille-P4043]|uniref:outer membrane protein assembly factor BamB family protein n=1 Tax=Lentibacillus sp. Marseille-P4043 TaxID=2040293 RepID=UPI001F23F2A4|nr:PQQ-binding-like beta-propeller repeat protein [Lentibacillus sp. Marseille-P4043]
MVVVFGALPSSAVAASFGPDEWNQYRLNSDKNAVFDNGSDALDYQEFTTADQVRATPVIAGNTLFIGNHNSGDLFAFDVTTGEKLWQSKAPNWVHSEMIYHDGLVYVGFGNRFFQENGIRGTEESGVLALDAETGDIEWKFNTEGEVMPTPAYYDGVLYVATGDKHLYKLDPANGELLHKADIGSTVSMSAPNITDDTLYVGGSGPLPYTFSAYDLQADEFKWQTEFPAVFAGLDDVPPAVSGDIVVTTALEGDSDNPEHFLYAMDIATGEILWRESLGTGEFVKNNKSGAPIIYEGAIYVGSPITKTFYAYDLKTGDQLWKYENEVMKAPPVAQDGIVYFSNTKGFIYALDAESGDVLGKKELGGKLAPSGPIIINDTLFVGSQDTNVYAVPLTDIVSQQKIDERKTAAEEDSHVLQYVIGGALVVIVIGLILFVVRRRSKE